MPLMLSKKTVIKFTILFCFSIVLFLPFIVSAQQPGSDSTCQRIIVKERTAKAPPESKGLEVEYPPIQGIVPKAKGEDVLPTFVLYIFYFAITISGLVAFGVIIYNGVKFVISAGDPGAMDRARGGIMAGILGIALLLSSFILLNTINPQFTRLTLERVQEKTLEERTGVKAGVYLLAGKNETEEIETPLETIKIRKNVHTISNIKSLSAHKFDNETESICVNPLYTESLYYNAILYTKDDYKGDCKIFYRLIGGAEWPVERTGIGINGQVSIIGGNVKGDVSGVKVFTRKFFGGEAGKDFSQDFAVRLYKHPGRVDDPNDPNDVCEIKSFSQGDTLPGIAPNTDIYVKTIQEACPGQGGGGPWKKDEIKSIEVGHGWILAAFQNEDNSGRCEVFGGSENKFTEELGNTYIGRCEAAIDTAFFKGVWKPCISSIAVFKGLIVPE